MQSSGLASARFPFIAETRMSYDSHASTAVLDSEISTDALTPSDSSLEENGGLEDESLSGQPDASEFAFGDELYDIDDVVELELFHPDNELPESHSSRGTIPGIIAAVLLHVWLFATFKNYILEEYDTLTALPVAVAMTEVEPEEDEPEKEKEKKFSLANPNDKDHEQNEALNATSTGIAKSKEPQLLSPPDPPMEMIDPDLSRNEVFDIPEGLILDESLVVKGTTGNALIQIEAALDRVTHEIAMNLKDKKVLVIWLIDGSASLKDQRELLAKRFTRIYGELDALEKAGQIPKRDEPLVTGVVSFGQRTKYHTEVPTAKFDEIKEAVESIEFNESGEENIFTAVRQVMQRWSYNYRDRQIMLVAITDESGDDFGQLERAINICRKKRAKAYVVGPAAPFGRRKGYVPYVAPENGQTYQIPVDLGPETARYENVLLPFWFSGPQYNYLSSGYGPYGLSRLVNETGGIYFMTNTLTMKGLTPLGTFESEKLRPFKPDYQSSASACYCECRQVQSR
jgi:hypothetical protein